MPLYKPVIHKTKTKWSTKGNQSPRTIKQRKKQKGAKLNPGERCFAKQCHQNEMELHYDMKGHYQANAVQILIHKRGHSRSLDIDPSIPIFVRLSLAKLTEKPIGIFN